MHFIFRIFISLGLNAGFFWLLSNKYETVISPYVGGAFNIEGSWREYIFLAIIFSLLNAIVKPILSLVTFPLKWITFGLVHVFINAFMLIALEWSVKFLEISNLSLEVEQWQTYIVVGLILGLFNSIVHSVGNR